MKSKNFWYVVATLSISLSAVSINASAQGAGANPDFNKAERKKMAEEKRLETIDKPLRNDPIGNALTGGVVTGAAKGAAAGAAAVIKGAATATTVEKIKEENKKK